MSCWELTLGKDPVGIRPIRIGDIWRQAMEKCVLKVARPSALSECSADQLCTGMKAGVEGSVHALSVVWAEMDEDERN